MGGVVRTQPARLEDEDFRWMVGRSITEIDFAEPDSWWLRFSGGGQLSTHHGVWRLLAEGPMVVSSEDHGHQFGLPEPVDVVGESLDALRGSRVNTVRVRDGAPDLELCLSNGLVLEVLALSMGYECWETRDPAGRCVVVSGSRTASVWQEPG